MQAVPLIGAAFSTPLVAASTALSLGSAVVGAVGARQEAQYRAAVASRQAILDQQNAQLVREAGKQDAMQQDLEAAAIMAEELATMGSRGFRTTSPSYIRRRDSQRALARRDRLRLIQDSENQARSAENRASSSRAEAAQARRAGSFALIEGGLNIGSSLIGGARLAGELAARRTTNYARTVGNG